MAVGNTNENVSIKQSKAKSPAGVTSDSSGVPLLVRIEFEAAKQRELNIVLQQRAELKESLFKAREEYDDLERQLQSVQGQLKALEGKERRDNLSIEYIKNIVIKYMDTEAGTAKK
eukprot:Ihof_evm1s832 gene=Ihof_evmTU1s832